MIPSIRPTLSEAEDFDYDSGQFINILQTNAYRNLAGVLDVDVHGSGGANAYRSDNPGLATENASDKPRQAYNTGLPDYDVGFNDGGKWGNYTRTFPAGVYNIYRRGSDGNGSSTDSAGLALVTNGRGTSTQTTTNLGTFSVPTLGGWQILQLGAFERFQRQPGSIHRRRGQDAAGDDR